MPKHKLDATFCLTARCEDGKKKTDFWDTFTTGFLLEARAGGGKTYALRYIDDAGRQRQHKLGRFEDISFDQARKMAKRLRAEVVMGGNPAARKAEKKAVPTYAELAADHLAHARTYQKQPKNTEFVIKNHLLIRWGKMRLDEITSQDIAKWFAEKAAAGLAPATVDKLRTVFGRSFELARQWKLPGVLSNPVRDVPRRKYSNARERYLSSGEVKRLFTALDKSESPQLKNIVSLLLLTGARKTELLTARWEQIDLERRTWLIPTTKTGKPRSVPLSRSAADTVQALQRWEGCPWLLPNPTTLKPYTDIKRSWEKARDAAGLYGLRLHDLRHSAASFMINAGIDLYAVGRVLGHSDHRSTQRYAHVAHETTMKAVEAGAANMMGA